MKEGAPKHVLLRDVTADKHPEVVAAVEKNLPEYEDGAVFSVKSQQELHGAAKDAVHKKSEKFNAQVKEDAFKKSLDENQEPLVETSTKADMLSSTSLSRDNTDAVRRGFEEKDNPATQTETQEEILQLTDEREEVLMIEDMREDKGALVLREEGAIAKQQEGGALVIQEQENGDEPAGEDEPLMHPDLQEAARIVGEAHGASTVEPNDEWELQGVSAEDAQAFADKIGGKDQTSENQAALENEPLMHPDLQEAAKLIGAAMHAEAAKNESGNKMEEGEPLMHPDFQEAAKIVGEAAHGANGSGEAAPSVSKEAVEIEVQKRLSAERLSDATQNMFAAKKAFLEAYQAEQEEKNKGVGGFFRRLGDSVFEKGLNMSPEVAALQKQYFEAQAKRRTMRYENLMALSKKPLNAKQLEHVNGFTLNKIKQDTGVELGIKDAAMDRNKNETLDRATEWWKRRSRTEKIALSAMVGTAVVTGASVVATGSVISGGLAASAFMGKRLAGAAGGAVLGGLGIKALSAFEAASVEKAVKQIEEGQKERDAFADMVNEQEVYRKDQKDLRDIERKYKNRKVGTGVLAGILVGGLAGSAFTDAFDGAESADTAEPTYEPAGVEITVQDGSGGIQAMIDLREAIRGVDVNARTDAMEQILNYDSPAEAAQALGLFDPEAASESFMLEKDAKFVFDTDGRLLYETSAGTQELMTDTSGSVLDGSQTEIDDAEGVMFDYKPGQNPDPSTFVSTETGEYINPQPAEAAPVASDASASSEAVATPAAEAVTPTEVAPAEENPVEQPNQAPAAEATPVAPDYSPTGEEAAAPETAAPETEVQPTPELPPYMNGPLELFQNYSGEVKNLSATDLGRALDPQVFGSVTELEAGDNKFFYFREPNSSNYLGILIDRDNGMHLREYDANTDQITSRVSSDTELNVDERGRFLNMLNQVGERMNR